MGANIVTVKPPVVEWVGTTESGGLVEAGPPPRYGNPRTSRTGFEGKRPAKLREDKEDS